MVKKQERNLEILYAAVKEEPDNPYYYFQIGCSLQTLKKYDAAIEAYRKGLDSHPSTELTYVIEMITSLASIYCDLGRKQEALLLMEQYLEKCNKANFVYCYANILLENDQPIKAVMNYLKATMMNDSNTLGEKLLTCYERVINIYKQTGNEDLAKPFEQKYLECRAERERIVNK